jgi:hypothetical protein
MKYVLQKVALAAAVTIAGSVAAQAHTVTFGWTDNGDGTVTLWNEHWHGDQTFPCNEGVLCSDNGGLTISGDGTSGSYGVNPFTVQWAGTLNNTDRDDMVTAGTLTGYQDDPFNGPPGGYDDWLFTQPLVIGDGTWYFFTGTSCCIDQMNVPVEVTLSGIGSVDPGTGPGGVNNPSPVPLPAAFPLLAVGLGAFGLVGWRRRKSEA